MQYSNKIVLFTCIAATFLMAGSCDKDDDMHDPNIPDYQAHIHSPNNSNKHVGDQVEIEVEFEDHNGGTVHHINVRIYHATTGEEIYSKPDEAHVHSATPYTFADVVSMNVDADTDWILEAKVCGHEEGLAAVSETVQFHVDP